MAEAHLCADLQVGYSILVQYNELLDAEVGDYVVPWGIDVPLQRDVYTTRVSIANTEVWTFARTDIGWRRTQ